MPGYWECAIAHSHTKDLAFRVAPSHCAFPIAVLRIDSLQPLEVLRRHLDFRVAPSHCTIPACTACGPSECFAKTSIFASCPRTVRCLLYTIAVMRMYSLRPLEVLRSTTRTITVHVYSSSRAENTALFQATALVQHCLSQSRCSEHSSVPHPPFWAKPHSS